MPKRNVKIADVVMVQGEAPRNEWPLGRITEVSSDEQGLIRSVKIKLGDRNFQKERSGSRLPIIERPVQKVVLLLEAID